MCRKKFFKKFHLIDKINFGEELLNNCHLYYVVLCYIISYYPYLWRHCLMGYFAALVIISLCIIGAKEICKQMLLSSACQNRQH